MRTYYMHFDRLLLIHFLHFANEEIEALRD